ncbi:MAG TPA: hypothetical protein VKV38_08950 [Trebonia sp.]|nr:hypothetical protein [Trebonia sp.]
MREPKRIGVVLPVGPKDSEAAVDTLASALYYLDKSRIIVVIDDTVGCPGFGQQVREMSPDTVVLPSPPRAPGGLGGLWVKIAAGYQWLLERYEPDIILRLDTDALIIGSGIEECAAREFGENPAVGLLGSYRIAPDGNPRDWSWPARRIQIETGFRGLRHPARWQRLRELRALARQHGYTDGEHTLGGSYIHSFPAADEIYARGWFKQPCLATSRLGEDHIMGLVTVAAGYRIADFGRPEDPMALKWRGLPAHPEDLLAGKKLVTHSVRSWGSMTEDEIRGIFRAARA